MATEAELGVLLKLHDELSGNMSKPQSAVEGFGSSLKKVGEIATGFLAANVISGGVEKVTGFFNDSIKAQRESIQVGAQLEAVVKSTGGAAGLTAQQMKDYAGSLEKNSLFEDEAIESGQAMLATFTNIKDSADGSSQVFTDATHVMVDMAQAMGTDVKSGAIQLGKALNDPIKGITALSRVGVTFDADQKKMISNFVKTGDVASAQNVILTELNKEFGGSAKAASDAAGKQEVLKDKMNDLKEQIGAGLIPIQEKWAEVQAVAVTFIAGKAIPILTSFVQYIKYVWTEGDTMNDWLSHLPGFLQPAAEKIGDLTVWFKDKFLPAMKDVVGFISDHWPEISKVAEVVFDNVKTRIEGFIETFKGIVEVVTGVVDLVSDVFHGRWKEAWGDLEQIAKGVLDIVIGYIKEQFGNIPEIILGLASDAAGAAKKFADGIADSIADGIRSGINWIIDGVNKVLDFVRGVHISIPSVDLGPAGKLGGGSLSIPGVPGDITPLALGGIVTRPTLALIGEAGPEAVVPLNKGGMGGNYFDFRGANIYGIDDLDRQINRAVSKAYNRGAFRGQFRTA